MRARLTTPALILSLVLGSSVASAQEEGDESGGWTPEEEEAPAASTPEEAPAPAPAPAESTMRGDGPRFRFGINGAAGFESVSSVSGPMFGLDMRLGLQLNDMLAIYAAPHLSFGSLSTSAGGVGISGATGTFTATVMGEATLNDMLFGGLGIGYGVLNNPSGFTFQARAGVYPSVSHDEDGIGRDGFMLGVDLKTVFISGATGILVTGCIGYEGF